MEEKQVPQEEIKEPKEETPEAPKETKDRTSEQFDKLTTSNKELKNERDGLKNVLDSLYPGEPKAVPEIPAEDDSLSLEGMVDAEGFLDGKKLVSEIDSLKKKAKNAEDTAKRVEIQAEKEKQAREQSQRTQKMLVVHAKYPELDPDNDRFNTDLFDAVRNDLISQLFVGKEDPMVAADKWYPRFYPEGENMAKTKEEKELESKKVEQKEQINSTGSGVHRASYESQNEEDLRKQMVAGKKGALAEMLRRRNS